MRERHVPTWVAALADFAVIVVFVAIGRRTHESGSDAGGFLRVLWPFALGLAAGWAATSLFRAPIAFRRAVPAWLITVAVGVALRIVVQGHELKPAFTVVALLFVGACMLGWRGVVVLWSRLNRRRAVG
jgi:hypothetical protein